MIDLSGAQSAHDMGDHFLLWNNDGPMPVYKHTLSPEEHKRLIAMCDGGTVPHMDKGGNIPPGDQSAGEASVSSENTENSPGPPPVTEAPAPEQTTSEPVSDADRVREFRAQPASTTITLPDGTKIEHGAAQQSEPEPAVQPKVDQGLLDENGQPLYPNAGAPPAPAYDPLGDATRARRAAAGLPEDPAVLAARRATALGAETQGGYQPPGEGLAVAPAVPKAPADAAPAPQAGPPITAAIPQAKPLPGLPGAHDYGKDLGALDRQTFLDQQADTEAKNALAAAQLQNERAYTSKLQQIQKEHNDAYARNAARQLELQNTQIDPQRRLREMGPFNNTLALIGLGLGTFGSSLTKTPNTALQIYQDAITQDIRAQEKNLDKDIHLNDEDRLRIHQEFEEKKADALDLSVALMKQKSAELAPAFNGAEQNLLHDALLRKSLLDRNALSDSAAHRSLEYATLAKQRADLQAQADAKKARDAYLAQYTGLPGSPGSPQTGHDIEAIMEDPKLGLKYHVTYRGAPLKGADGFPLLDKDGLPEYPKVRREGFLQHEEDQGKFADSDNEAHLLQEPVAVLQRLASKSPEGTIDFSKNEEANQAKLQIADQLTRAVTGSSRLSETNIAQAKAMSADLGVWNAISGKTDARLHSLQRLIDGLYRENEGRLRR